MEVRCATSVTPPNGGNHRGSNPQPSDSAPAQRGLELVRVQTGREEPGTEEELDGELHSEPQDHNPDEPT